jgi:exodeoxyribonuclease-5
MEEKRAMTAATESEAPSAVDDAATLPPEEYQDTALHKRGEEEWRADFEDHAEMLTDEQTRAYRRIGEGMLREDIEVASLTGYAGTGKTTVARQLCQAFDDAGVEIRVAAPTHRAAREIGQRLGGAIGVWGTTIHSILGLELQRDGEGGYHLVKEGEEDLPEDGGIVICDEASMIGRDLWSHIQESLGSVRWIFLGDPGQLPPVNEDPSPVLDVPGVRLETVVRQARENPVLEVATRIRNGEPFRSVVGYDGGEGVAVTTSEEALLRSAAETFRSADPAERSDIGRVLAYTNDRVDRYNREIRERVEGEEAPEFVEGEWLVVDETYYRDEAPVVVNAEMIQVVEAERTRDELAKPRPWEIWKLTVEGEDGTSTIPVLAEESRAEYHEEIEKQKTIAKEVGHPSEWRKFYELKEQYASVSYGFASTVHKAQGATFETVFADLRDIRKSRDPGLRQALMYVAATRPSKRLAFLQ